MFHHRSEMVYRPFFSPRTMSTGGRDDRSNAAAEPESEETKNTEHRWTCFHVALFTSVALYQPSARRRQQTQSSKSEGYFS